jgi:hypothetical protein
MVSVTLRLYHDDGARSRHLRAKLELPGVPRKGERIRAGDVGSYFAIEEVFWDDRTVDLVLGWIAEHDQPLGELLAHGWTEVSTWPSSGASRMYLHSA